MGKARNPGDRPPHPGTCVRDREAVDRLVDLLEGDSILSEAEPEDLRAAFLRADDSIAECIREHIWTSVFVLAGR